MRKIRLNNFVDLKDKTVSSHKLRIQEMEKEWYEYTHPLTFCEDIVCSGIPKQLYVCYADGIENSNEARASVKIKIIKMLAVSVSSKTCCTEERNQSWSTSC